MSDEAVGRAGFHVRHAKDVGDRDPIVDEAMRELDDERLAHWMAKNPNIVKGDEPLDVNLVNDGSGQLVECTDKQQVLDYGKTRLARLSRKLKEDVLIKKGPNAGKMMGGSFTTSLIVSHLPKSMCVEVPNYYPRYRRNGQPMIDPKTGEQMYRSRWVARDRDEAIQYFRDIDAFFTTRTISGGAAARLAASFQFSESTPHGQWIFDTMADDPDNPDKLRVDTSRQWFSHKDDTVPVVDKDGHPVMRTAKDGTPILDEDGQPQQRRRMRTGREKLETIHAELKKYLIEEKGYDISPDFDELRHLVGQGKAEYERAQDAKAEAEALVAAAQADHADYQQRVADAAKWLDDENARLDEREADLDDTQSALDTMAASLENRRANLDDREQRIVTREQEVDGRLQEAEQALREARAQADAIRAQVERLEAVPADIDQWLDTKAARDGRTFRDIYDRTATQRRQRSAETLRIVDQHTSHETGVDDAQLG